MKVLERGVRWWIGDGSSISVYEDRWLPKPAGYKVCSPKFSNRHGKWNEAAVVGIFFEEETGLILDIHLSNNLRCDSLMRHFNKRGFFSVKSAYRVAIAAGREGEASCSRGPYHWWKKLWKLKIPNKRPVKGSFQLKIFCLTEIYIILLLFFLWIKVDSNGKEYEVLRFIVTSRFVWFCKNKALFDASKDDYGDCWDRACKFLSVYRESIEDSRGSTKGEVADQRWTTPAADGLKLNVDAALHTTLVFSGRVSVEVAEPKAVVNSGGDIDNIVYDITTICFRICVSSIDFVP
ncbi:hypothetical protein Dsin_018324 [Dipteronia sinensis]|uniref:Uncharacterized protein n=1 Tax=Dipteronia sinensis TaxID=43782 RepID=A0AAE0A6N7_9ROSI|nr:hypothetical protein Dsin_018324 [Dipteronia sinensis]